MPIVLLTVGRPRDPAVQRQVEAYRRRTPPPYAWVWEPVPEGRRQADVLSARLRPGDQVVALDPAGQLLDSPGFAARLEGWIGAGRRTVFVIGGAEGLPEGILARADWRWSLSPLTFPHELACLLAAEQLYRAWAIRSGHPYHK
jgi:23S rRNA (pseudouridine1915-N3)-methyltransferase